MEVTEAIEGAEADLARTLDELRMAKEMVASLTEDAQRMRLELTGLKSFANRQGLLETSGFEPSADVVPISGDVLMSAASGPDISLMARSEAVATVMRSAAGPLDRTTIHQQFFDGGRFDTIDDISLSLSGLKRAGRVERLGHGLWQLVEDERAAEAQR